MPQVPGLLDKCPEENSRQVREVDALHQSVNPMFSFCFGGGRVCQLWLSDAQSALTCTCSLLNFIVIQLSESYPTPNFNRSVTLA